jgi:hypothetical protein
MSNSRCVLLIACLVSCSKSASEPAAGAGGQPGAAAAASPDLIAKINVYVACINNMNPQVRDSRKSYLEWAPAKSGPTMSGAGRGVRAVSRETTYGYDCFKRDGGLDAIDGKPPKVEALDKAGAGYKAALVRVMEVTAKAAEYYDHHDYKDDKLARGKELHGQLLEAYGGFDAAAGDLEAAMQVIQDKLDADRMAHLEKTEGKRARWHQRNLMRAADLLIRGATAEHPVDPAKIAPLGEAYTKAFQDLKAWTDANKAEADKEVSWGSFVREADELLTQIKELNRGVRDQKRVPESGNGSVDGLIREFNSLVSTSNGLWD